MKEENNEVVNSKKSRKIVLYIVIAVIIIIAGIGTGYLFNIGLLTEVTDELNAFFIIYL